MYYGFKTTHRNHQGDPPSIIQRVPGWVSSVDRAAPCRCSSQSMHGHCGSSTTLSCPAIIRDCWDMTYVYIYNYLDILYI